VEQSAVDQSLKDKLLSAYIEKLRQAIQAALIYPVAAKQMGITGRVRVQFELNAGQTPTQVTILDSSGTGMFDRYAVKAVNEANYPSPPTELKASNGSYQIWVEFKN
jgi:protein TonB